MFIEHAIQMGLRPPADIKTSILGPNWFRSVVELPNAGQGSVDLLTGPALSGDATINSQFSPSASPELRLHLEAVCLKIVGPEWIALSAAEKLKVIRGCSLKAQKDATIVSYDLGRYVSEPVQDQYSTFDSDGADAIVQHGSANGHILILPRPLTLDTANDKLSLEFSEDTPAGPIAAHVEFFGAVSRNSMDLGMLEDDDCEGGCVAEGTTAYFDQATGMLGARFMGIGPRSKG